MACCMDIKEKWTEHCSAAQDELHAAAQVLRENLRLLPENVRAAVKLLEGDQSRSGHVTDLKATKEVS